MELTIGSWNEFNRPSPFVSSEVETRVAQPDDMAFWAYILRCADDKYYTGHTDDLERRVAEHHHGGFCDFTSRRRPVTLIWCAEFPTRYEALSAELQVKKWSRAKKEALAASDWARLSYYARPPCERVSTSAFQAEVHPEPVEGLETIESGGAEDGRGNASC